MGVFQHYFADGSASPYRSICANYFFVLFFPAASFLILSQSARSFYLLIDTMVDKSERQPNLKKNPLNRFQFLLSSNYLFFFTRKICSSMTYLKLSGHNVQ